ncbi:hypothetical protein [Taklimakanibacter deserti]|uniref:hypothetical protein n=1 Tax=Taklimakanibacter deserti TaxID=2267839 RepID=UPI0013C4F504
MTAIRHWLATLSVFAFGTATQSYVQPAEAKVTAAEIERACEKALRANTIEALEHFLHKYPPSKYRNDVACYALALDALGDFEGSSNGSRNPSGNRVDGGYGS